MGCITNSKGANDTSRYGVNVTKSRWDNNLPKCNSWSAHPKNMSTGYFRICPKCFRKYGRHFTWCIDCTPRAEPDKNGLFKSGWAYKTRHGIYDWQKIVRLRFCCSKELDLDKRLALCAKCRARIKCFTQNEDK